MYDEFGELSEVPVFVAVERGESFSIWLNVPFTCTEMLAGADLNDAKQHLNNGSSN